MKIIHGIEIKDGYLLVVRKNGGDPFNMTVAHDNANCLGCVAPENTWFPLNEFDESGKYTLRFNLVKHSTVEVCAIYGRTTNAHLLDNSLVSRDLLWERKEIKKMTVAEICDALGYEIEIVKEKND